MKNALLRKKKDKIGSFFTVPIVISLTIIILVILTSVFAAVLAPHDPNKLNLANSLQNPSWLNPLGTDKTGRDMLSRLLFGSRTTLLSGLLVVVISVIIGVPQGLVSGYFGGKVNTIIMRTEDVILAFPALLLAFIFVASFGKGIGNAILALGIVYVPMISRLTRSLTLVEKSKTYVESARSIGFSNSRILFRHIFPNCIPTIIAQLTLDIGYAILDLAAMSFLGLGVQPPISDWGAMLEEGRAFIQTNPILALAPGIAIIIIVVAFNVLSDNIQMYLDPDQRKLPPYKKLKEMAGGLIE
jgi:peptide/nickel transport system permease protein